MEYGNYRPAPPDAPSRQKPSGRALAPPADLTQDRHQLRRRDSGIGLICDDAEQHGVSDDVSDLIDARPIPLWPPALRRAMRRADRAPRIARKLTTVLTTIGGKVDKPGKLYEPPSH